LRAKENKAGEERKMYEDQNVKYLRAKDMIKQLAKDGHEKNIKVCTNCYLRNTVNYH